VTHSAKPLLLVVDDDANVARIVSSLGHREGFQVITCSNGSEGIDVLRRRHVNLMFLDLHMPEVNGLDVLKATQRTADATHIVLMTGSASIESAVEAVKLGAEDYITKPLDFERATEIMRAIHKQFETRATIQASDAALATRLEFCGMVGRSPVITKLFDLIRRLAPHARSVLVTGETGTGKELVARAFHQLGPRRANRFVTVNCSAIVETLIESELFGHARGAFTGAVESRQGVFEAAHGGVLFLDEIGELPMAVQSKLLRVLETGELQRVGAVEPKQVDVRVVAATNRNLQEEIAKSGFRADLYYRLSVLEVTVPPLRERIEDIPYLTAAFVRDYSAAFEKAISGITPNAEDLLLKAAWPGNVRQLKNVIERACMLSESALLTEVDVERALGTSAPAAEPAVRRPAAVPSKETVLAALEATAGNKVEAARRLGVSRRTLYRLLERHEVTD